MVRTQDIGRWPGWSVAMAVAMLGDLRVNEGDVDACGVLSSSSFIIVIVLFVTITNTKMIIDIL